MIDYYLLKLETRQFCETELEFLTLVLELRLMV